MSVQDSLIGLAQSFRLKPTTGPSPLEFAIELLHPVDQRGGLTLVEEVTSTVITPAALDLVFRTKDVRWLNTDIANQVINGGMPVADLLSLNVAGVTTGPTAPPGVPGLIGALQGTIPIPIVTTQLQQSPVTAQVRWRVLDGQGHVVSDVNWSLGAAAAGGAGVGGEIVPPINHEFDILNLVFQALFTELVSGAAPVGDLIIEASINLTALGISSGWITLPPVPLKVPLIPVPTVAIFYTDTNFQGMVLIIVPSTSPLDQPTVTVALDTLGTALQPLAAAAAVAQFFVNELAGLKSALSGASRIAFRKADDISNLSDVELEPASFWDWNGENANDEFSSLVFLGCPRRHIECFNDSDLAIGEGKMNVSAGPLLTKVASLHMAHKADVPVSDPPNRVTVVKAPDGWNGSKARSVEEFGDELTSIRFGWD